MFEEKDKGVSIEEMDAATRREAKEKIRATMTVVLILLSIESLTALAEVR